MKTIITFLFFLLLCYGIPAQNTLTIDDCQSKARNNYPLIRQFGLIEQSKDYNLSNLSKTYLPQLSLNGQATYQSEVTQLPIRVPGIDVPTIDKDQYKATIDLTQTIWDGGNTRAQKKITNAGSEVEKQHVEVELYSIRDRVNQLFFGILTLDEQLKQLDILDGDLQNSYKMVDAMRQNGTATSSDVDAVQVELLNNEQRKTELQSARKAYTEMLSALINEKMTDQTTLQKPVDVVIDPFSSIQRPEITQFDKQRELYDAQERSITAKNSPKFSLFAQGGYGKPGLNMLSNDFDFFALGGLRLSWNLGHLYTRNNEKQLINIHKNRLLTQEETFIFNTNLQLTQTYNEVLKAKALIQKDNEIIALRHRIKNASQSKYENGVYTINDLLRDINTENQARQAKILHEINYLFSVYNYKNIQGN